MATSERPSLHTPLQTHKQSWLFRAEGFFPLYSETHTPVAKCPLDVRSASWENIANCMCHHQSEQQGRSPEEEVMEEVEVRGFRLFHVRGSGEDRCYP